MSLHKCRLCGADLNRSFVDLGMSPLCESYIPAARLDDPETFYPLHVLICESCLAGLAGRRGTRSLPMVVHPLVWTRRRLALPGGGADDWPTSWVCRLAVSAPPEAGACPGSATSSRPPEPQQRDPGPATALQSA